MKSGLEDRNNGVPVSGVSAGGGVSMKSGLEDRNNEYGSVFRPSITAASQ